MSDLRSIVVKEACTVLVLLAEHLKVLFEPYVAFYIPALLRQIIVKIKIIADSADQCIRCLINETQVKNIKAIVEGSRSQKDLILRKRCTEYMIMILSSYDEASLERLKDYFEAVILGNLSDAAGEVRMEARKCYWIYAGKWKKDGMRIFSLLDPLVQKYLNKDAGSPPDVKRIPKSLPQSPLKPPTPKSKILNVYESHTVELTFSDELEEYTLPSEPQLQYPIMSEGTAPTTRKAFVWQAGLAFT